MMARRSTPLRFNPLALSLLLDALLLYMAVTVDLALRYMAMNLLSVIFVVIDDCPDNSQTQNSGYSPRSTVIVRINRSSR